MDSIQIQEMDMFSPDHELMLDNREYVDEYSHLNNSQLPHISPS